MAVGSTGVELNDAVARLIGSTGESSLPDNASVGVKSVYEVSVAIVEVGVDVLYVTTIIDIKLKMAESIGLNGRKTGGTAKGLGTTVL